MRKEILLIVSIILITLPGLQAQVERGNFGFGNESENGIQRPDDMESETDSTEIDVKPVIKMWQYNHKGVYRKNIERDTSIDAIHRYNLLFDKSISNTYLGNICSPGIENIFIKRKYRTDFLFLKPFDAYLQRYEEQSYYNTTTPYTDLTFKTGGQKRLGESFLRVLHTQNVNPYWNAGIKFNINQGDGQYMHQKSKIYDFAFFSSYEKDRLSAFLFVNQNVGSIEENGGVTDEGVQQIKDTTVEARNLPVKMTKPVTNFYNFNLYAGLQYNIGNAEQLIIGNDTLSHYPLKLVYSATVDENERKYKEESIPEEFYKNTYLSQTSTYDKFFYSSIDNDAKIVFNEKPGSLRPGMFLGLSNKTEKFGRMIPGVSGMSYQTVNTQYFKWGIYKQDSSALNFDINLDFAFAGYKQKDIDANALVKWNFSKNYALEIAGEYSSKKISPFISNMFTNHYAWINRNLDNENKMQLKVSLLNDKRGLDMGVVGTRVKNYIYFDNKSFPAQKDDVNVFTAYLTKNIRWGKMNFKQSFYYQRSSDEKVLSLPQFSLYSSNYFKDWFFSNALEFAAGVDLYFNSMFYTPDYNPALTVFHNQRSHRYGDYPKADVFVNLRIKRAMIFIKYEHFNYHFSNKNYFSTANYPINPAMIKYGVRWYFYN